MATTKGPSSMPDGVREAVQRAHAVHRHAEREAEGVGGHQADAQSGVGAGAHPGDDAGHGVEAEARVGEHPVDGGKEQFSVPAGVHLTRRCDDGGAVVQGDGDGGRCGIQSEQEHANSLRLRRAPHGRSPLPAQGCGGC